MCFIEKIVGPLWGWPPQKWVGRVTFFGSKYGVYWRPRSRSLYRSHLKFFSGEKTLVYNQFEICAILRKKLLQNLEYKFFTLRFACQMQQSIYTFHQKSFHAHKTKRKKYFLKNFLQLQNFFDISDWVVPGPAHFEITSISKK